MRLDLAAMDRHALMQALSAALAPRPIVLMTTVSRDGLVNLAPFSSVVPLSASPPLVGVAIHPRSDGTPKTTLRNVRQTGEFVVNSVTPALADAVVDQALAPASSGPAPSRLRLLASDVVRPPRVAESPLQLECRVTEIVMPTGSTASLVVGEVVLLHAAEALVQGGVVRLESIRPLGHLGTPAPGSHVFSTTGRIVCISRTP